MIWFVSRVIFALVLSLVAKSSRFLLSFFAFFLFYRGWGRFRRLILEDQSIDPCCDDINNDEYRNDDSPFIGEVVRDLSDSVDR